MHSKVEASQGVLASIACTYTKEEVCYLLVLVVQEEFWWKKPMLAQGEGISSLKPFLYQRRPT